MKKIKLVTHSGKFHADDVFATAILSILFEKKGQEFEVIRSRDPELIESGDIVYDNGTKYDPDQNFFDHHQKGGAGERENSVPYAAFGLIWKHYGKELISQYFNDIDENSDSKQSLNQKEIDQIHQLIDQHLVQSVDASDTGYEDFKSNKNAELRNYLMDSISTDFNPTSEEGYQESFDLFIQNVEIFKQILIRNLIRTKVKIKDFQKVEQAYQESEDKRIIILEKGWSWKEVLIEKPEPLFVIFPTIDTDGFIIQTVNKKLTGYETRKSFPESWRGKTNKDLEKETGISGSKFCHSTGFMAVAEKLDQAVELAKVAVDK